MLVWGLKEGLQSLQNCKLNTDKENTRTDYLIRLFKLFFIIFLDFKFKATSGENRPSHFHVRSETAVAKNFLRNFFLWWRCAIIKYFDLKKIALFRSDILKRCINLILEFIECVIDLTFCYVSVFVDGLYCSLCELVSPEVEQTNPISLLLWDINNKDIVSFYSVLIFEKL